MIWFVYYMLAAVAASPFTFQLRAAETVCWYAMTDRPNTQFSYYFAVQNGGSFDIDYTIKKPNGEIAYSKTKESNGDYQFKADQVGEWEFCFKNGMSSYADKIIDFEISHDSDASNQYAAKMPSSPNAKPIKHVTSMESTVAEIDSQLDALQRAVNYYKTRNNRNEATVRSTEGRIFYFSVLEVLLMVGMAGLQIAIVQLFFKGSRKQLV
ncbi:protein Erp3p [Diutina catenulata]